MSERDTLVTCPCCKSRLDVDLRTGKVLRWSRAEELDETGKPKLREADWDQAANRVQGRLGSAVDKFDASLDRERSRARDLDELFKRAKDKIERKEEDD